MEYLETEELVVGKLYVCILYDNSKQEITLTYIGNGYFEDDCLLYSDWGDVRYVLREVMDGE